MGIASAQPILRAKAGSSPSITTGLQYWKRWSLQREESPRRVRRAQLCSRRGHARCGLRPTASETSAQNKREIQPSLNLTPSVYDRGLPEEVAELNSTQQQQDQQDDDHEAEAAAAIVTGAVERSAADAAEATEQCDDEDNKNDRS